MEEGVREGKREVYTNQGSALRLDCPITAKKVNVYLQRNERTFFKQKSQTDSFRMENTKIVIDEYHNLH